MALEAAKGMLYLHSRADAVLHRDLKSANLLVDKHWRVKVADFNLSRVMNASAVVSSVSATNPRCAHSLLAGLSASQASHLSHSSTDIATFLADVDAMCALSYIQGNGGQYYLLPLVRRHQHCTWF